MWEGAPFLLPSQFSSPSHSLSLSLSNEESITNGIGDSDELFSVEWEVDGGVGGGTMPPALPVLLSFPFSFCHILINEFIMCGMGRG